MMLPYIIVFGVLASLSFLTSPARSDQYPLLNVTPLCHALTDQSTLQLGLRDISFDDCMKAEQSDRQTIIDEWSTFSADDRRHCIAEATMGGESSYTDLLTCLEMARDVRKLYSEADSLPVGLADTFGPHGSSPAGTVGDRRFPLSMGVGVRFRF